MNNLYQELPEGKKVYFASDFHLGAPNKESSDQREKKIVRWLNEIENDAHTIFLVGDIFDFWFEYKKVIPKGFHRLLGKLADLRDKDISVHIFIGNHDLWMFDYFPSQFNIPVHKSPQTFNIHGKSFYVGHGDGLGPGDRFYKFVKLFFTNRLCQWLFQWLHPNIGVWLAQSWSNGSRMANDAKPEEFEGDNERLLVYAKEVDKKTPHDFYIFGHRHLPLEMPVSENSVYFNLGEWVTQNTYVEFDGNSAHLKTYK